MKYGQAKSYCCLHTSSDFLPWQNLLLWVTVMIYKASEGILPDLVIRHYVRFYVSPFIVVDYLLRLLDPEIFWGDKSWWVALAALEPVSATGICSVKFFLSRQASVWQDVWHRKNLQFISQFSKLRSNLQIVLISKRFELLGWDWTHMKDFSKLFPNLTDFPYLSLSKVKLFMFIGERRLML